MLVFDPRQPAFFTPFLPNCAYNSSCPVVAPGLQERANQQQTFMSDLRREKYVTQGAFMAAQLCKADKGELAVQRGKLDLVCSLLISAGVLDQGAGGEFSVSGYASKHSAVADQAVKRVALEEKIARVESAVTEARDEGHRATMVAAEASKAAEKVAGQCRQVERKCATAGARSSVLEEGMDEGRRRTEANSTRIYELSAEVERLERLAESNRNSLELVATSLTSREDKNSSSAEEVAGQDLNPHEKRLEVSTSPGLDVAPEEAPREGCGTPDLTPKAEWGDFEEDRGVITTALVGASEERVPRRPGVLGPPGPPGCLEADTRKHTTTPTSRRRSTRSSRRVFSGKERVQPVDPVRPQAGRPRAEQATPNSWARASWPSLANEKDHHLVRPESCLPDKADTKPGKRLVRECSTPNLIVSPEHKQLWQPTGSEASLGCATRSDDPGIGSRDTTVDLPPRGCHGDGDYKDEPHTNDHESGDPSTSVASTYQPRSTNSQHRNDPEDLATTTVGEADALLGALTWGRRESSGRRGKLGELELRRVSEDENNSGDDEKKAGRAIIGNGGGSTDLSTGRADSRGGRLAYLEGVPKFWRPRATWDLEAASSSGSSTSVELQ